MRSFPSYSMTRLNSIPLWLTLNSYGMMLSMSSSRRFPGEGTMAFVPHSKAVTTVCRQSQSYCHLVPYCPLLCLRASLKNGAANGGGLLCGMVQTL